MPQSSQDQEALKEIARLIAEKNGNGAAEDPGQPSTPSPQSIPDGANEALDASLLGRLLESIPAAIAIIVDGKLIRANECFAMAFGFRAMSELMDAGGLVRILSGESGDLLSGSAGQERADEAAHSRSMELEGRTKSGRQIDLPAVLHCAPGGVDLLVLHPSGAAPAPEKIAPAVEPGQHISEAGEEKATPSQTATSTDANTVELLAKVSHEVRTPLNSIIGFAELMQQERFGPLGHTKYKGYAEDIVESGNYALGIVNDLLDLSKIRSGNFEMNFAAVDANEIVEDCVHLIETKARQERVVLRVSLNDEIPMVLADRRSLKQILLNLLSNAVKFTQAGGQVIVSSVQKKNSDVVLRVRDTGVGMSESDIAQAMKPFQQLDTAPRQQIGTGLGLPLTKALTEANRAHMTIESARRVGTSIEIRFPADRVLKD